MSPLQWQKMIRTVQCFFAGMFTSRTMVEDLQLRRMMVRMAQAVDPRQPSVDEERQRSDWRCTAFFSFSHTILHRGETKRCSVKQGYMPRPQKHRSGDKAAYWILWDLQDLDCAESNCYHCSRISFCNDMRFPAVDKAILRTNCWRRFTSSIIIISGKNRSGDRVVAQKGVCLGPEQEVIRVSGDRIWKRSNASSSRLAPVWAVCLRRCTAVDAKEGKLAADRQQTTKKRVDKQGRIGKYSM